MNRQVIQTVRGIIDPGELGLTLPHEPASDDVIDTTEQVLESIQPLTQARMDLWVEGGLEALEAAELGFETVHDDLLHHGELRGVEIKLTNMVLNQTDSSTILVNAELGVSDGDAMLNYDVSFTLDVQTS